MRRALDAAVDPADIALLPQPARRPGLARRRPRRRRAEYAAGLAADPAYQPLLRGRARVAAATGRLDAALADAADGRGPHADPDTLMEYAELLRRPAGPPRPTGSSTLADAAHRLFAANGGTDDLTGARSPWPPATPDAAVRPARAEWQRRPHADVADMLAWALHAAGPRRRGPAVRPPGRRGWARATPRTPTTSAMVSLGLGDRAGARTAPGRVRDLNPYFSPADGPTAARALSALEARPMKRLLGCSAALRRARLRRPAGRPGRRPPAGQLLGQPVRRADPAPRPGRRRGGGDLAELPTLQDAPASCAEAWSALTVTVDGTSLRWSVADSSLTFAEGAGGLRTSRLACRLSAPAALGRSAEVTVANRFRDDRIGWRELAAAGSGVRLTGSSLPAASVQRRAAPVPGRSARVAAGRAVGAVHGGAGSGFRPRRRRRRRSTVRGRPLGLPGPLAGAERRLENAVGGRRLTPLVGRARGAAGAGARRRPRGAARTRQDGDGRVPGRAGAAAPATRWRSARR